MTKLYMRNTALAKSLHACLEQVSTIRDRLTGFSRPPARQASRFGLVGHKRSLTQSGGREKPACRVEKTRLWRDGGPNQPIGGVAELARSTRSRCVQRLAEWTDLAPSNDPVWSKLALAAFMLTFGIFWVSGDLHAQKIGSGLA